MRVISLEFQLQYSSLFSRKVSTTVALCLSEIQTLVFIQMSNHPVLIQGSFLSFDLSALFIYLICILYLVHIIIHFRDVCILPSVTGSHGVRACVTVDYISKLYCSSSIIYSFSVCIYVLLAYIFVGHLGILVLLCSVNISSVIYLYG